ncbi:MAG: hypothetical protein [Caudoviricetes sp.]|nr:MAG: hypothetical protein [Caudoviricetes sp.]
MLQVITNNTTRIVAGKLVQEDFSYVADAEGNLVGRKAHATVEDAQAELAGLGGFAEGLEFAKAQFPELGEKAHVAKANVIAEFLAWGVAGKPVKEAKAPAEADEQPQTETVEETF